MGNEQEQKQMEASEILDNTRLLEYAFGDYLKQADANAVDIILFAYKIPEEHRMQYITEMYAAFHWGSLQKTDDKHYCKIIKKALEKILIKETMKQNGYLLWEDGIFDKANRKEAEEQLRDIVFNCRVNRGTENGNN